MAKEAKDTDRVVPFVVILSRIHRECRVQHDAKADAERTGDGTSQEVRGHEVSTFAMCLQNHAERVASLVAVQGNRLHKGEV